jgi:hypothetical protein
MHGQHFCAHGHEMIGGIAVNFAETNNVEGLTRAHFVFYLMLNEDHIIEISADSDKKSRSKKLWFPNSAGVFIESKNISNHLGVGFGNQENALVMRLEVQ